MAWVNGKRTVYCRQCYQKGHNRRGCPQLSETTKARMKNGDLARKCSWCRQSGHTKVKCEMRQTEIATYVKENGEYRAKVLGLMEEMGIGIGALVVPKRHENKEIDKGDLSVITAIDWDNVQLKGRDHRTITTNYLISGYDNHYCMPALADAYWAYGQLTVVNKAKYSVREDMPADWLSGKSGADKMFK